MTQKKSKDLEAQIAELGRINSVLRMNYDEMIEDNEALEELSEIRAQNLQKAYADLAAMSSTNSHLIAACKELLRRNKELQHEKETTTDLAPEAEELPEQDQED